MWAKLNEYIVAVSDRIARAPLSHPSDRERELFDALKLEFAVIESWMPQEGGPPDAQG